MEAVGNNSEKMATGSENFARLLVLFLETGIVGNRVARPGERRYTECRKRSYQSAIKRTGKSRGIASNGGDKADSGKKAESCRTSPIAIGQGNRMETVGNNSRNTETGSEKFRKHPVCFHRNRNRKCRIARSGMDDTLRTRNRLTRSSGAGKSRGIISNGEDKADSGKKVKGRHTSPPGTNRDTGQGSCKETVGNNSGNTVTGMKKSGKHMMFKRNRNRKSRVARLCWSDTLRFGTIIPVRFRVDRKKLRNYQQ
jgi:hypothetical protein